MKTRLVLCILVFASLAAAGFAQDAGFDAWSARLAEDYLRVRPQDATALQYFSGTEQDALDRQLNSIGKEAQLARVAEAQKDLGELARFDRARLSAAQKVSAATIEWTLQGVVESEPFSHYDYVFHQFRGLHVSLVNFLTATHPIRNRRDIENYLVRLALVSARMDEGIALARERAGRGFLMPRFITVSTLGQFERFLADAPAKNPLVATLAERSAKLTDLPASDRARFLAEAEQIVTGTVIPAFRRAQALLQEQLPRTNDNAGLAWLPGGDRAYANALKRNTTTNFTPQQIHEIGLREVARIEKEMDTLLRQLGLSEGNVSARFAQLDRTLQPPSGAEPRPMLLARYTEILRDAERRAALLFDETPKAPIEVRREPLMTEPTAAAHYTGPSRDGTLPGVFWAPLPGPNFKMLNMRTLVYHEGVPGHHFQIALQRENSRLPRYRSSGVFAGGPVFSEGWALYAENLAAENGWYEGDPRGRLGQLEAELFRARRLVVDTGLHAMKWTRQQAIDYGIPAAEVERYVVNPGQACAYKVGMLRILELRGKAQSALGARFSLKEFHNVVLRTGNVPLEVLGGVVDDWIASKPRS